MFEEKEIISLAEAKKLYAEDEIMLEMDGWAFNHPENIIGYIVNDDNQVSKWISHS